MRTPELTREDRAGTAFLMSHGVTVGSRARINEWRKVNGRNGQRPVKVGSTDALDINGRPYGERIPGREPDPATTAERRDLAERVVSVLSPREATIMLRLAWGDSAEVIAEDLALALSTVYVHVHSAEREARRILGEM